MLTRAAGRRHAHAHEQLFVVGIVECVERLAGGESPRRLVDPMQLRRRSGDQFARRSSRRMSVPPSMSVVRNGRVESAAGMWPASREGR